VRVLATNEMHVALSLKEIVITAAEERFAAAPILLLGPPRRRLFGGAGRRVPGVGIAAGEGTTDLSVSLFEFSKTRQTLEEKQDYYLAIFFRYGVNSLIARFVFKVKPRMRVSGLADVEAAIDGSARDVIQAALLSAGAQSVEFE
jgi:hypothetical protein